MRHGFAMAVTAAAVAYCVFGASQSRAAEKDQLLPVPDEIRVEATRPSVSGIGHALPLCASWNDGGGFTPAWQLEMIQKGHYLLPWMGYGPQPDMPKWTPLQVTNYFKAVSNHLEAPLHEMARLRLPLVFMTTQWEQEMQYKKEYLDLQGDESPRVVTADGKILDDLSPFGPVAPWSEVGKTWTEGCLAKLQEWYPNPPLVIFLSNNETARLSWTDAEQDRRYVAKYGKGKDDAFKRDAVAKGWQERYRAIQKAFVAGFASPDWKRNTIFIGYNAWGYPGRPPVAGWDGGSPEYYVGDYTPMLDFIVNSPEIHFMNHVCMVSEMYKTNPKFWYEYSTWDGNQPDRGTDKMRQYAMLGQTFPPERYGGFVQFGMWLNRPRCVRDFRGSGDTIERVGDMLMAMMDAVDRVHTNPILRAFWRKGELVPNRAQQPLSPSDPTSPCKDADRWFLLDTSLDPQRPWTGNTALPVMSIALVQGQAPKREWLVYAYAPAGTRTDVAVTVPDFGPITIDASQAGSFYLVSEQTKKTTTVFAGGPASVRPAASPQWADAGKPVSFSASDLYDPTGKFTTFRWDFGDGAHSEKLKADHAYSAAGTYVAKLTASDGKGTEVVHQFPIYVGQKTDSAMVVRYPMMKIDDPIVYDASGRGNNGLRTGGKYVDDPERGTVLELDGKSDCVPLFNTADINTGGPYANRTISLWFKANNVKNRQTLWEEGGAGNGINLYLLNGKFCAGEWVGAVWPGMWLTADKIPSNQWVHVAMVLRDAAATLAPDKLELYVNGKKVASGQAAALQVHTADINLGRCASSKYEDMKEAGMGFYFGGRLGEVRVYNRALSEAEIAELAK